MNPAGAERGKRMYLKKIFELKEDVLKQEGALKEICSRNIEECLNLIFIVDRKQKEYPVKLQKIKKHYEKIDYLMEKKAVDDSLNSSIMALTTKLNIVNRICEILNREPIFTFNFYQNTHAQTLDYVKIITEEAQIFFKNEFKND